MRGSGPRHADRERSVSTRDRRGHTPSRKRMEWKDCSPTHSLWEQSPKRYRNVKWCTKSGDVRSKEPNEGVNRGFCLVDNQIKTYEQIKSFNTSCCCKRLVLNDSHLTKPLNW